MSFISIAGPTGANLFLRFSGDNRVKISKGVVAEKNAD